MIEGDEEVVIMTVNDGDVDAGGGVTWHQVALIEFRMQKARRKTEFPQFVCLYLYQGSVRNLASICFKMF